MLACGGDSASAQEATTDLPGSSETPDGGSTSGAEATTRDDTDAATTEAHATSSETGAPRFDVGMLADAPDGFGECQAPGHEVCDGDSNDIWHAMGIGCGTWPASLSQAADDPRAFHVHEGPIGTHEPAPFPPRGGSKVAIMSTGFADQLPVDGGIWGQGLGEYSIIPLPPPMVPENVSDDPDVTCAEDPSLVGTGDCSNTIQGQWLAGMAEAHDYAELRMVAEVPGEASGISFDFAVFSAEYPQFYYPESALNDMFIVWLESDAWTGNISFDEDRDPISLSAVHFDYKDAPNEYDCPACFAPELAGTSMVGHAGTQWLTTKASVRPGETIELIFAIYDAVDSGYDLVSVIDNFQWICYDGPPVTAAN
ncbi:MAG: choice-of-anchor L domain-containing protein [Deltaproteobacteria bacterium]|nr:choice-of-anchor L domain-containing protein [Nannocystaceae bacterium]